MLDTTYDPAVVEEGRFERWRASGAFSADPSADARPYCVMMPPPNVTGSLHVGHALTFAIQDALIRYHRMKGEATLWQPGTDHAGIATQMMVERQLADEGLDRRTLGREAFLARVWDWKEKSGGTIVEQLRRLGASADWSRERFTMDEGLSRAVRKAFVDLHAKGLIYKDNRLVNWDPALETAISDLEVDQKDIDGKLWYFDYPIADAEGRPTERVITVATTRPETMLGDSGVAVHPEDARYADLVGKRCVLPIVGRLIPICADEYADPEKGAGAVKITPAHDFNDFEVGRRQGLELISVLDERGRINDAAPEPYRGLDRYEARKKVVAEMEALGRLRSVEPHRHMVPHSQRSGVAVEPFSTVQWYCDAHTLAQPAIAAVESGQVRFAPETYANTYFEWMRNIQPWCISRQLWWGHRIPAWYGPDGEIFVATSEEEAIAAARAHYGEDRPLSQDEDVLDTWFSSALWPFSTLGWPEQTPELKRFYPTSTLVTGWDIIFFWVARMMMMGIEFMGEPPFSTIVIHGLVRDEDGQKMSKTKGNVIDPLDLIERYGADALRFAILASTAQGRDVKLGEKRVESYRNFFTKLWNATRFVQMNGGALDRSFDPAAARLPINRWIAGAFARCVEDAGAALDEHRFDVAAGAIYRFAWDRFCDWWIELAKPILQGEDAAAKAETQATAAWVLVGVARLIHPMAPFVSEALAETLEGENAEPLISARWPDVRAIPRDRAAVEEIEWLIALVSEIRSARGEMAIPPGVKLALRAHEPDETIAAKIGAHRSALERLARLSAIETTASPPSKASIQLVIGEATYSLPLEGVVDFDAERARLEKEIAKQNVEIEKIDKKLANADFLARAPAEVVEIQHQRKRDCLAAREAVERALDRLS